MMLLPLFFCLVCADTQAQTWEEWFRQKKTQRKYLAKQIALLKIHLEYLKKGYDIAQQGLTLIGDIKDGEFGLHRSYFASLKDVNPQLARLTKVADTFTMQAYIVRRMGEINAFSQNNPYLTPEEIRYVATVYTNLLKLADASLGELLVIVRAGESQMTDDERLARIDLLYADMLDKHAFVRSFENDVHLIAAEREREMNAIDAAKKQQGLI